MYKLFIVLLINFIFSSISYSNDNLPCFENKKFIDHNSLEKLTNIRVEIVKLDKWLKNAFNIVRNNGWIKRDLKKNHRANIYFEFKNGFKCSDVAIIRFHGDNPDHYKFIDDLNFVSSLNIKLLNTNVDNITEFKLLLPETRFDEREIITSHLLKELEFLSPRTKKIDVNINNFQLEYLFQEKISKELIEFNNFPEGPIIEGDQRFYHIGKRNLQLGRIVNKRWSSRNLRNAQLSISALSILNEAYLSFYSNQDNFEVNKNYVLKDSNIYINNKENLLLKKYFYNFYDEFLISIGGEHALVPDNRSFYYNYFEGYFYPIYYDGNISFPIKKIENFDGKISKNLILDKFSKIDYNKFFNEVTELGIKKMSYTEFETIMNGILNNLNISAKKKEVNKNLSLPQFTNYYNQFNFESLRLVFYLDYPDIFYICDNLLLDCYEKKLSLKEIGNLLSQNYKDDKNFDYIFVSNDFEKYSKGLSKNLENVWSTKVIENHFNINFIEDGIKLDVNKDKKIIKINQTNPDGRVFFFSQNKIKNWKIIFNSNFERDNKQMLNTNRNHLDGCITFYGVEFEDLNIKLDNGVCEDSINFVKSIGSINKIEVSNSFSDAIDMDFSQIQISSAKVTKSGNDCVDMSFGKYLIKKLDVSNCYDNGISVGEKSKFKSVDLFVKNSKNGLAVKDSSIADIENLSSINNSYCFRLYNKKNEFLGGELKVKNLDCDTEYFIDKVSKYN